MKEPLASMTMTSEERKNEGVKGLRKTQVKRFLRRYSASELAGKEKKGIIVMDKACPFAQRKSRRS